MTPRIPLALVATALLTVAAVPAAAQYGSPYMSEYSCDEARKNTQCNEFGTIKMDSQVRIDGQPVVVPAQVTLNTNYEDRDARWVLFSIRNVTDEGSQPISVALSRMHTVHGDVLTTEVRRNGPNEINVWVHAMDIPVGETITLDVEVGASERGAYQLEILVMPFDRGYAPIRDAYGQDQSLFSFTLLSVREPTGKVGTSGEGGSGLGKKMPGPALPLLAVGALAAVALRRRKA